MQVIDVVRKSVRQHALAQSGTRVVVAVSGGSDSMALAYLLREMAAAGELQVAGVAHFNHRLRETADRDERFVHDAAEALGWPAFVDRADVAARARRERRSIEDAARTSRHEFFERAREHFHADVVALGHTRDDQAETFLLRLVRGAGPRGLASMHPRHGAIVRPLLACRRADLRTYLAGRNVAFVEDESNRDTSIPRNRVRAELLPLIEARFNPAIVDVLADEAEIAREMWQWMDAQADELVNGGHSASPTRLDVGTLNAAPAPIRRFAVWRALTARSGGRPISFGHVEAVLRLMDEDGSGGACGPDDPRGSSGVGRPGGSAAATPEVLERVPRPGAVVDAPGQRVERRGSQVVLTSRRSGAPGRPPPETANFFHYPLSIPGEVALREAGCVLSVERSTGQLPAGIADNGPLALVRSDLCMGPLAVRNRRPGDRFSPVGLGGRKKLQDFFVDRKVARRQRDAVPLVVDETDRIVWVAGYGIDEAFRVTDPAQAVLILRLKRFGGSA
jgi:tRNA(Ile)-lysidine synthase